MRNAAKILMNSHTLGLLSLVLVAAVCQANEPMQYNRDVRPILASKCFACHGPDSASRKADLRLDQRQGAIDSGAIQPAMPDESELVARIFSEDPEVQMPPPESKKVLTAEEKRKLQDWIAQGAIYDPLWSLIPPQKVPLPKTKRNGWARNEIDHFVLSKLEQLGLDPAPEADRRTLARRLALDLTGIPPTPEMVERFLADTSADAYEKYCDTLMSSSRWGEHQARYWLDVARYADSHGIHFDNYREMWSYRDWVIQAFNRNLPFDRFTLEQIAGDLLPDGTLEQQVASGFNRCHMTTNEGGAIDEEYLVLYARDRTETVARVWMGLTANCAVCHDHKFDPISQREFYELSAFFNNTTQTAMDGNIASTPPVVMVPRDEDRVRWQELAKLVPAAKLELETRRTAGRSDFQAWLASARPEILTQAEPLDGLLLRGSLRELVAPAPDNTGDRKIPVEIKGETRSIPLAASAKIEETDDAEAGLQPEGSAFEIPDVGDFEKDQPFSVSFLVKLPANDSGGAIFARMDNDHDFRGWDIWFQQRQIGTHIIDRWPDNALKVVAKEKVPGNTWTHITVQYDGSGKANGVSIFYNGTKQENLPENDTLAPDASIRTSVPFRLGQRNTANPASGILLRDLRIYQRTLVAGEIATVAGSDRFQRLLVQPEGERSPEELDAFYAWWLATLDSKYRELLSRKDALESEQGAIQNRGTVAYVMHEKETAPIAYVLHRGEYNLRREQVGPETLDVLPQFPTYLPMNRIGLAQWLMLPEQPLTARVTVNRFWQQIFGTGLVKTSEDFGVMGEPPSHPELLDWLAVEFRQRGWDMKGLVRLMVTSATYRQSAVASAEKLEKDPANRFLSRGPRFRMDAEMVRDTALFVSGLLREKLGGPSVKPYQPPGVWEAVAMMESNTRYYRQDSGDNLYRRSLYTFWKRAAPPASMDIFNAPSREMCTVRRERTNTPLQALVTLNDPQFVEAARHLAERTLSRFPDPGQTVERIDFLARALLSRPFSASELQIVRASLERLAAYYAEHRELAQQLLSVGESRSSENIPPHDLATWTMLTNQLMNLDEVLNK
jgi:Protein of unknown function (DUF1553)/Protein of unknown function (DUF1549)/Planctomycete cytochrome C/Concanavalin A-like lectin/glucanases superfamily